MTKHTPGPRSTMPCPVRTDDLLVCSSEPHQIIARFRNHADAYLDAAAPEMYAMLDSLAQPVVGLDAGQALYINSLLAKARGEA